MRLIPNHVPATAENVTDLLPFLIRQRGLTADDLARVIACQRSMELSLADALLHLRLATAADIEAARNVANEPVPAAGNLPAGLLLVRDPFHPQSEQLRALRGEVLRRQSDPQFNRLAVVSANEGDGRSTLAASLAIACAQLDQPTLLIDADLRAPAQDGLFSLPREPGLGDYLVQGAAPHIVSINGLPNLSVLTAGRRVENPLDLLSSRPFKGFLDGCRQRYRHVIVDTPALSRGADAMTVAAACGAALAVTRLNHSVLAEQQDLFTRLESARVNLLGAVLSTAPL